MSISYEELTEKCEKPKGMRRIDAGKLHAHEEKLTENAKRIDDLESELSECEASNKAVEAALKDVNYKGPYAEGVKALKVNRDALAVQVGRLRDALDLCVADLVAANKRIYDLEAENASLRLFSPAQKAKPNEPVKAIGPCNLEFFGVERNVEC